MISEVRSRTFRGVQARTASAPLSARARCRCRRCEWTPEVERATAHLYERVRTVISPVEWPFMAPYVKAINELKAAARRRHPGAQLPDAGDLPLRRRHRRRLAAAGDRSDQGEADDHRAVRRALHGRDVEDPQPGQDGADPGRARRLLAGRVASRARTCGCCASAFPGVPVVTYVNTSADVKAEIDICCTSSNAVQVVESLGVDRVIFLPDEYLGANTSPSQTDVKIIVWKGALRGARALHRRRSCAPIASRPVGARSSPIPSARPTCWPRPTSPARPRT